MPFGFLENHSSSPFLKKKNLSNCSLHTSSLHKQIAPKCTDLPPSAQIAHKQIAPKCAQIAPKPSEPKVKHKVSHSTQQ